MNASAFSAFRSLGLFVLLLTTLFLAGCVGPTGDPPAAWRDPALAEEPITPAPSFLSAEPALAPPPTNPPIAFTPPSVTRPPSTPPPPVTTPAVIHPTETWVSLERWARAERLTVRRQTPAPSPTYVVSGPAGAFTLQAGGETAQWNGLELRLGFPPQMIGGQPFVHHLDLQAMLQPLLGGVPGSNWGGHPIIVLDPGHGGGDVGTKAVNGHYEKEYTLDWALRLQRLLATNGWPVFLTRSNDAEVALTNRVAFADARKASLFISLHFNSASPNQTEAGLETYLLTPSGMPSSLVRGADNAALSFPNNAFDIQNLLLALRVHRALLQINGDLDRGVRHARFLRVLQGQQRPAILIEGGYLSNVREARLIADPGYMQKLAEAVAGALVAQCRVAGPVSVSTSH